MVINKKPKISIQMVYSKVSCSLVLVPTAVSTKVWHSYKSHPTGQNSSHGQAKDSGMKKGPAGIDQVERHSKYFLNIINDSEFFFFNHKYR